MQLRTRRIMFWSLIPCFVIGGTAIVLYSQGFRIDTSTWEPTKVGALYVRGFPREATVTLDGEPLDTGTWWPLSSGTLVNSLAPGEYALHASAEGHQDWDATVTIRAALVTERKSLTLFPNEAQAYGAPVAGAVSLAPITDGPAIIAPGTTYVGTSAIPGTFLGTLGGRVIMQEAPTKKGETTIRIQSPTSGDTPTRITFRGTFRGVFDDSILVDETPNVLVAYSASGRRSVVVSAAAGERVTTFLRTGTVDVWTTSSKSEQLYMRARGSDQVRILPLAQITDLQPSGGRIGALDDHGSLWLINTSDDTYTEVGHRVGWARWNPDGTSVLALVDDELEVIPLKSGIPHGVLTGLMRGSARDLGALAWYPDDEHFFLELGDQLYFVDIISGDRDEQHWYTLPLPKDWLFDGATYRLYTLTGTGAISYYELPG